MTKRKNKKEERPFSKILHRLMSEKEMTLKDASEVAGLSISTVSDWRNGAAPENYLAVQRLANHLGVSLSFILTGSEDVVGNQVPSVVEVFEEGDELFDGYAQITIKRLIPRKK